MDISQIRYVLEAAKSSSMREASLNLYISQPALSSQIKALEEELGILIFERTNKGISLTDEGREFTAYAKKLLGQFEIMEERYLSKDRDKESFSVSIQHYNFAVKAFSRVIKKHRPEKFVFSINETKTREVLEDLTSLKSEVGVISYSASNKDIIEKLLRDYKLDFKVLMKRNTFVYLWHDHELALKDKLSLKDLRAYTCVNFDQSDDSNFYLSEEALSDYDFKKLVKSSDRATSIELIKSLKGFDIGSGMLSCKAGVIKGLKAVKLEEEDPLTIGYIIRKEGRLSTYGLDFIRELEKFKD